MIARNWTWVSLLICVGFLALPQSAVAQSDGDRALMERERQVRERLRAEEEKRRQDESYEQQRKQNEKAQKDRDKNVFNPLEGYSSSGNSGAAPSSGDSAAAAVAKARKDIQKLPPLAADRNPLLGRWRVASVGKARGKDDLSQLMGMLSNPGGAACEMLFGEGITEFQPKSWASIDRSGTESLGPIQYRMNDNRIFALPDKGIPLLGFEIVDKNRIREVRMPDCVLVRVDSAAAASGAAPGAPSATPRAPGAQPKSSTASQAAGAVADGAAFRCGDGSLLHVSFCQGNTDDATCTLAELHLPGLQMGKSARRADIAARVNGCEAGSIRYGAGDKPIFVR